MSLLFNHYVLSKNESKNIKAKKGYQERHVKGINIFSKKKRKQQYGSERFKILVKNEKQRLTEYRKNYFEKWKNASQHLRYITFFHCYCLLQTYFHDITKIADTYFTSF